MIYVTGDGFAAASYAASPYSWARQDTTYFLHGTLPHPKNLDVSFANRLSLVLHQPIRTEAYELALYDRVFAQIEKTLELDVQYMVVSWPSFFRYSVEVDGTEYSFKSTEIEKSNYPANIKAAMRAKMGSIKLKETQQSFIEKCNELCNILDSRKIHYSMMMGENKLPLDITFGRWLLNPKETTVKNWAEDNQFLNDFGFLSEIGHKELGKLLIVHLTNQL
jgi:hypothetical protein